MTDDLNAGRADRIAEVRKALGLTQQGMADRLNAVAAQLDLPTHYTALSVSQRETGRLRLDEEDYAVISAVPEGEGRWSWSWLAFGRELPATTRTPAPRQVVTDEPPHETTIPPPGSATSPTRAAGGQRGRGGRGR